MQMYNFLLAPEFYKVQRIVTSSSFSRPCFFHITSFATLMCSIPSLSHKSYEFPDVIHVPDIKSRNVPEVVLVRRWAVGVLGIWRGGVGWVKGGANGVSLQAT
jgi:hypothetical protein